MGITSASVIAIVGPEIHDPGIIGSFATPSESIAVFPEETTTFSTDDVSSAVTKLRDRERGKIVGSTPVNALQIAFAAI